MISLDGLAKPAAAVHRRKCADAVQRAIMPVPIFDCIRSTDAAFTYAGFELALAGEMVQCLTCAWGCLKVPDHSFAVASAWIKPRVYISPIGEGRLEAIIAQQHVSQAAFFQILH